MVATKAALSIRVDALTDAQGKSEESSSTIGVENRTKLESRLRALERQVELGGVNRFASNGNKNQSRFSMSGQTKVYNAKADAVDFVSTQRDSPMQIAVDAVLQVREDKKRAKEEKKAKTRKDDIEKIDIDGEAEEKESKKERKRKRRESGIHAVTEVSVDKVSAT